MTAEKQHGIVATTRSNDRVRDPKALRWRVPLEILLIFLTVEAVIITLSLLLRARPEPVQSGAAAAIMGGVTALALLLLVPSYLLARPLYVWLEKGRHGNAPERIQKLLLAQPRTQSFLFALPWLASGTAAAARLSYGPVSPVLAFLAHVAAALAILALVRIRVEDLWRPFVPLFFGDGDDPTQVSIARRFTLARRFMRTYLFASLFPLAMLTMAVFSATGSTDLTGDEIRVLVFSVAGIGAVTGAMGIFALSLSTLRSVRSLQQAAHAVEAGSLDVTVKVDRADELGDLERNFNDMVTGLRMRDRIEDLFERQVGAEVARYSLEEGTLLGGQRCDVSALFIDLASFTSLAEATPAEAVVTLLNRVFGTVVAAVGRRDGLVNKFAGDAALAVFGAPRVDTHHATHALLAAAEIAAGLEDLGLDFGIGVASGEVVAGNVGALSRYEYTVIGDAVNVAARLEERTRDTGHRVLVAGSTVEAVDDMSGSLDSALVPLGRVRLKGKDREVRWFALDEEFWREVATGTPRS